MRNRYVFDLGTPLTIGGTAPIHSVEDSIRDFLHFLRKEKGAHSMWTKYQPKHHLRLMRPIVLIMLALETIP